MSVKVPLFSLTEIRQKDDKPAHCKKKHTKKKPTGKFAGRTRMNMIRAAFISNE